MQPYIPYHNCTTFNPYYSRNQETSHEQIGSPYHTDERFGDLVCFHLLVDFYLAA